MGSTRKALYLTSKMLTEQQWNMMTTQHDMVHSAPFISPDRPNPIQIGNISVFAHDWTAYNAYETNGWSTIRSFLPGYLGYLGASWPSA